MKKKYGKVIKYLFVLLGVILVCILVFSLLISNLGDPSSYLMKEIISSEQGVSLFNPQTILSDIRDEKKDIFIETVPDTEPNFPEDGIYNNVFRDEELYEIAEYFFQSRWDEDPDDWRLVSVYYDLYDCGKGFNGPFSIDYSFMKKNSIEGEKYISERTVSISEWKNQIGWTEKVEIDSSIILGQNWKNMNYYGMDVFKIAEENGGKEIHAESKNQCEYVTITIYGLDRNWEVDYNDHLGFDLLELEVNKRTGKVKK
jgi:hypothetical protein